MYIFFGIVLIIAGIIVFVNPEFYYELTQDWKNGSSTEPSESFILATRFGGIMSLLLGIGMILVSLVLSKG